MIGPDHVMGLAIGNEIELLKQNGANASCISKYWNGTTPYAVTKFQSRVADLDKLDGDWKTVKVTLPASEAIFGPPGTKSFWEDASTAKMATFVTSMVKEYKDRFAFSLNTYPYFNPANQMDPGSKDKCTEWIGRSTCFGDYSCLFDGSMVTIRQRMANIPNFADATLWVTETGWSSPVAETLTAPMTNCPDFSSDETLKKYYSNFLSWDLKIKDKDGKSMKGPDHVFYLGMRDATQMGKQEHFGLGEWGAPEKLCTYTQCKLKGSTETGIVV
jgi:hypothetical protein